MPIISNLSYHPIPPKLAAPIDKGIYPVDKLAIRLVNELARVGYEVPGWDIHMQCYGTGNERYIAITEVHGHIAGARFYVRFNRMADSDGTHHFHDTLSISEVCTPHCAGRPPLRFRIYEKAEDARLDVYCGDNWDAEYHEFHNGTVRDRWRYILDSKSVFAKDPLEEYDSMNGSGISGLTYEEVMGLANGWLARVVDRVVTLQSRPVDIRLFACPEPDKLSTPVTAYALISDTPLVRISAHERGVKLKGWANYAMVPNRTILPRELEIDVELPRSAFQNYIWLSLFEPNLADYENYSIFRHSLTEPPRLLKASIRINNDAFVADLAAGVAVKRSFWADHAQLTDQEVNAAWTAVARTMVPLDYYVSGKYSKPILLLSRELGLDEVELV